MAPSDFRPLLRGSKAVAHGWVELLNCWTFEKAPPQNSQKPSAVFSQTSSNYLIIVTVVTWGDQQNRQRTNQPTELHRLDLHLTNSRSIFLDNILNSWCFLSVLANHVNMINMPFGKALIYWHLFMNLSCNHCGFYGAANHAGRKNLPNAWWNLSPWDAWRAAVALPAWAQP